jgi:predicted nucleic acid-binding protein
VDKKDVSDFIVDFYKNREVLDKEKLKSPIKYLVNPNIGLGDSLSISSIPKLAFEQGKSVFVYSPSPHFKTLKSLNPYYKQLDGIAVQFARADILQGYFDCGPGHLFQRLQRACGLIPQIKPQGVIVLPKPISQIKNKIVLHLSVGECAELQKRTVHPRARELYPEHRATLQRFVLENQSNYEFVEVGTEFSGLYGVNNKCGLKLLNSIEEVASAEFFIGMDSGVMHIAAALNIKSIILTNFPNPEEFILPILKDTDIVNLDWMFPFNVHFSMDSDGPLVKFFTYENLIKAINGEVYPFWSDEFLKLEL